MTFTIFLVFLQTVTQIPINMKKVFKICSGILVAVAIAGIGYWNASSRNPDVNLSELIEVADVDAECSRIGLLTGTCITMMDVCTYGSHFDPNGYSCDPCYIPRQ